MPMFLLLLFYQHVAWCKFCYLMDNFWQKSRFYINVWIFSSWCCLIPNITCADIFWYTYFFRVKWYNALVHAFLNSRYLKDTCNRYFKDIGLSIFYYLIGVTGRLSLNHLFAKSIWWRSHAEFFPVLFQQCFK